MSDVLVRLPLIWLGWVIARGYVRMKRGFDLAFGVLFGAAALNLLTSRFSS